MFRNNNKELLAQYVILYFMFLCILAVDAAPAQQSDPNKKMTVLINIEQPDIILVEDMNDINCLALILNVSKDTTDHVCYFAFLFYFEC